MSGGGKVRAAFNAWMEEVSFRSALAVVVALVVAVLAGAGMVVFMLTAHGDPAIAKTTSAATHAPATTPPASPDPSPDASSPSFSPSPSPDGTPSYVPLTSPPATTFAPPTQAPTANPILSGVAPPPTHTWGTYSPGPGAPSP